MRIFVGTLYSGENEYTECLEAIQKQSFRNFKHFIFENLPNKEAHDKLYNLFLTKSSQFDLLVKVDADMVLCNRHLFRNVVERFAGDDNLEHLEIPVHDFFSNRLIWGMNIYRNTIKWRKCDENLFVDTTPVYEQPKVRDKGSLTPAATHCHNPGCFQAFHYGLHKGIKILQRGRKRKRNVYTAYHWENVRQTWQNFLRCGDVRIGLAALGAETAIFHRMTPEHVDYANRYSRRLFNSYERMNSRQIRKAIRRMQMKNWGFLPESVRRKVVCYLDGRHAFIPESYAILIKGVLQRRKSPAV